MCVCGQGGGQEGVKGLGLGAGKETKEKTEIYNEKKTGEKGNDL